MGFFYELQFRMLFSRTVEIDDRIVGDTVYPGRELLFGLSGEAFHVLERFEKDVRNDIFRNGFIHGFMEHEAVYLVHEMLIDMRK